MIDETLLEAEEKMEKAVAVAKDDFAAIRTGRAHPAMFNKIVVDYYGTLTPVNQLASFQVPEARMAVITPYDKGSPGRDREGDPRLATSASTRPTTARSSAWCSRSSPRSAARVHQGRPAQGGGRPGLDPQHPPARQGRARPARSRTARPARTTSAVPRRSSRTSPTATSPRSTSCSSTRKPSCSRSDHPEKTGDALRDQRPACAGGTPAETLPPASRAGRNLPIAVGVGLVLGVLIIGSLFTVKQLFVGVVAVGDRSWASGSSAPALRQHQIRLPIAPVAVGGTSRCSWRPTPSGTDGLVAAFALTVVAVLVWRLLDGPDRLPARRDLGGAVRHRLPAAARRLRDADARRGRRAAPDPVLHHRRRRQRHRWLRGRACCSASTPWHRRSHPRSPGRASPAPSSCCAVAGGVALPVLLDGAWWQGVLFGLAAVCTAVRRRPVRVHDQARPRRQGHGAPAARPRRPHGPARLAAALRPGRLAAARARSSR